MDFNENRSRDWQKPGMDPVDKFAISLSGRQREFGGTFRAFSYDQAVGQNPIEKYRQNASINTAIPSAGITRNRHPGIELFAKRPANTTDALAIAAATEPSSTIMESTRVPNKKYAWAWEQMCRQN
jgi:hypothetical protein